MGDGNRTRNPVRTSTGTAGPINTTDPRIPSPTGDTTKSGNIRMIRNPNFAGYGGGGSPGDKLAAITNQDFANYQEDFAPVEDATMASIEGLSAERDASAQAQADFSKAASAGEARLARRMSRSGSKMNAQQQAAHNKAKGLAEGRGEVGAGNIAFRAQNADDATQRRDLLQAGNALKGQALQGLGAAAQMSGQRDAQGKAAKSQAKQQMVSNAAMGAGIGYMAVQGGSVAGPYGAAIGAGVGIMMSLF